MDWRVKGVIQKTLSTLPGGLRLNSELQRFLGGLRNFDHHAGFKVGDWSNSMGYLAKVGFSVRGARIMEIGSGWLPTFPICFFLAGASSVATFDIVRLMSPKLTLRLLDSLEKRAEEIALLAGAESGEIRAKLADLRQTNSIKELLCKAGIEYYAPADGCASQLEADSVDLVYSNSVLEHVPKEVIAGLLRESMHVLKPGGLVMHNVGCNDHYAFFDRSISFVNFLQYDERQWKRWNNPIQYQNRLRAPEFLQLAAEAGLEVVQSSTNVRPDSKEALQTMRIAPQFARFSAEDLAKTSVDFIARKPRS